MRDLLSNNSLFVGQLYEDKSLALRARDFIFFTTDLQTVNFYATIHCWSWSIPSVYCSIPLVWETSGLRKRKLVALLLLSYRCLVTENVLWLLLEVPWVGIQCVIVVFPDHSHLLFDISCDVSPGRRFTWNYQAFLACLILTSHQQLKSYGDGTTA